MGSNDHQVTALSEGRGFVVLDGWRVALVRGGEARAWLNDLLSAEVDVLEPGRAVRSLLLSPTGRIRADVHVADPEDPEEPGAGGLLLIQDPVQPDPVHRILAPYVLSSDVSIEDRTGALVPVAVPGGDPPVAGPRWAPSVVGPGVDLLVGADRVADVRTALARGRVEADAEALDRWRVGRGVARTGVDLGPDSLPHEASLEHLIGWTKGCFLGQEAAARVRNLGHPPFVILSVRGDGPVSAGDPVRAAGREVGLVTSAVTSDGETRALIRVRWAARAEDLATASGTRLQRSDPAAPGDPP